MRRTTRFLRSTETPTIAPSMGTFIDSVIVELTTTTPSTTIHYTFDGTTPTLISPKYSGPFTLTHSARVTARAFALGNDSGVVSAFLAISPAKSRLYLPIVQALLPPIETAFDSLEVDHKPDKALVGIRSWKSLLTTSTLLLVIGVSILIWHTTKDAE